MVTESYRLPDGRIVEIDATAAKADPCVSFQLEDRRIVTAVRIAPVVEAVRRYASALMGQTTKEIR